MQQSSILQSLMESRRGIIDYQASKLMVHLRRHHVYSIDKADLVQEGYMALVRHAGKLASEKKAYSALVIHGAQVDFIRRVTQRRRYTVDVFGQRLRQVKRQETSQMMERRRLEMQPDVAVELRKFRQRVNSLLTGQDLRVIEMIYWQDMTIRDASKELGVSESRGSQIHKEVIGKLRKRLRKGYKHVKA